MTKAAAGSRFLFFLFLTVVCLAAFPAVAQLQKDTTAAVHSTAYSCKIVAAANATWGYDIYAGKKLLIHQQSVPGRPGLEGFKTRAVAERIARLVISKLRDGEMPPTVTEKELKKYHAI